MPPPFGRLPAREEKFLPEKIWRMGRNSSGIYAQFETDSDRLAVRWELEDDTLREPLFNVCAHSGLDLYRRERGRWLFTATLCPFSRHNEEIILRDLPPARRRFRLYFPFRNCVSGVAAGDWSVTTANGETKTVTATEEGGLLVFTAPAGVAVTLTKR